jgi:glycosyltransferase involved in cell wall biosynthesis
VSVQTHATPQAAAAVARAPVRAPARHEDVVVVIPAYNEAGRVGAVVRDVRAHVPGAEVVVVNDGSADATAAEACAAGATVLTLPVNVGYGAALQTGYKYAVRRGFEIIGQIDADGQHRAEHFPHMLEELHREQVDVVVGSRFLDRDGHYRAPAARKLGIALFGRIASVVTREHISDPTSGFQILRAPVARFFSTDVYPSDYPDADILILLHRSGFRVREVPVQMRPSPGQSMHGGHKSLYYVYKMLLSISMTLLRPKPRH